MKTEEPIVVVWFHQLNGRFLSTTTYSLFTRKRVSKTFSIQDVFVGKTVFFSFDWVGFTDLDDYVKDSMINRLVLDNED